MKLKKLIIAATLVFSFMVGNMGVMEAQAACSGYIEYATGESFCDNTDGCGFLWLKDTRKTYSYQMRYCDEDGMQVLKTRALFVKDGCC